MLELCHRDLQAAALATQASGATLDYCTMHNLQATEIFSKINNKDETFLDVNFFVFLQGFGNSGHEFDGMTKWLDQNGGSYTSLVLTDHDTPTKWTSFLTLLRTRLSELEASETKQLILVATSVSALAIVEVADDLPAVKAVLISPYFGCGTYKARALNTAANAMPWLKSKREMRKVEVTARRLRSSRFNAESFLVIHSYEDKVSCYNFSKIFYEKSRGRGDFVTIFGTPHMVASDIEAESFFGLLNAHFSENDETLVDTGFLEKEFVEAHFEHRFWANKISTLVLGFFTAFSFFVYQTLPSVISRAELAPYILMAYTTIVFAYIIMTSLYLFYMNRIVLYLFHYIEPLMPGVGFTTYKFTVSAAGSESRYMSFASALVVSVIPFIIAVSSLLFGIWSYLPRFTELRLDNALLISWCLGNIMLYAFCQSNMVRVARHAVRYIFEPPVPKKRARKKIIAIFEFLREVTCQK